MNMVTKRLSFMVMLILPVLIVLSYNKQKKPASSAKGSPEASPFNPYYFKSDRQFNYAVKLKFKDGTYQFSENNIYKLPVRPKNKINRPDGSFQVIYLDENNWEIGRFRSFSPREVLIEKVDSLASGFSSSSIHLLNETEFFLPLHPKSQTRSIRIIEKGLLQEITLTLPVDTVNIIEQNKKIF